MRRFLRIALLLAVANPAFAGKAVPTEWVQCQSHADCVVAPSTCGEVTGVNRSSAAAFKAATDAMQARIKCRWSYLKNEAALKAVCTNNACAIAPEPIYGYER